MPANSSIILSSLDFDTLKSNLKTFMRGQDQFRDYDFDGASLNVLLDVLAYNSYLNSFYLNMAMSEFFLDSAQMRSSVVSRAKELNYTPRSIRSAKATINLSFTAQDSSVQNLLTIPKGTRFSGLNSNGSYTFVTDRNQVIKSTTSTFGMNDIPVYEGFYINETFVVDNSIEDQRYVLTNGDVDTTSIEVTLIEDNGATQTDMIQAMTIYDLTPTSAVYFLQATLDNSYEIMFGDGIFGRRPKNAATILVTYRVASGSDANGVASLSCDQDIGAINGGTGKTTVTVGSVSSDGSATEDIETIRRRAPRSYQAQQRAVTSSDYKNILLDEFPEIKDISIYGGEDISDTQLLYTVKTSTSAANTQVLSTTVNYGKVFISPSTTSGTPLSESRKADIIYFLRDKRVLGIQPVLIDPEYLYIVPNITVSVNFNNTSQTPAGIESLVRVSIDNFNTQYLQRFDNTFRFSKFTEAIDNTDVSILSNMITTQVYKSPQTSLNINLPITINFHNELIPGTMDSSEFLLADGLTYSITDYNPFNNTMGRELIGNQYKLINANKVIYLKDVVNNRYSSAGSIDYSTGIVSLKNVTIVDYLNNSRLTVYASTFNDDIRGILSDVVEIDTGATTISIVSA
jgi:hypothetical protein